MSLVICKNCDQGSAIIP